MRIDLHIHSTASDGSLAPNVLIETAHEVGLDVVALADHDTTAGLRQATSAAAGRVHIIPALEISVGHGAEEFHLLGYYIDPEHARLVEYERTAVVRRRERMATMIERLAALGLPVAMEAVDRAAGDGVRTLGRPHLARALCDAGHASSIADAFERWIGNTGPAYVAMDLISMADAIDLVHDAGGLAVWAHPEIEAFRREIHRLQRWGLDGVECYRPRCSASESLELEATAGRLDLIVTGGSDWHGIWNGRLGSFYVGRDEVSAFLERGGI